jgi:hypothetical protein
VAVEVEVGVVGVVVVVVVVVVVGVVLVEIDGDGSVVFRLLLPLLPLLLLLLLPTLLLRPLLLLLLLATLSFVFFPELVGPWATIVGIVSLILLFTFPAAFEDPMTDDGTATGTPTVGISIEDKTLFIVPLSKRTKPRKTAIDIYKRRIILFVNNKRE